MALGSGVLIEDCVCLSIKITGLGLDLTISEVSEFLFDQLTSKVFDIYKCSQDPSR